MDDIYLGWALVVTIAVTIIISILLFVWKRRMKRGVVRRALQSNSGALEEHLVERIRALDVDIPKLRKRAESFANSNGSKVYKDARRTLLASVTEKGRLMDDLRKMRSGKR